MYKKMIVVAMLSFFTISACASKSDKISARYVSPLQYQHYTCDQVGQEMARVGRKVSEISGQQDAAANKDAAAMAVGMIIFWPALFFLIGGDKKEELANLKGEYEALEGMAIQKECTTLVAQIEENRKRKEEIEKAKKEEEEKNAGDKDLNRGMPSV